MEADKALYGSGEYELAPGYNLLKIDAAKWHRMTGYERQLALSKYRNYHVNSSTTATNTTSAASSTRTAF